ncbi:potassium/sodium hyperpolarization-activated cyclic nucleotide-gated channel 1-like [Vespa mandarinia]|uniref:potassium/sodium hyperpolarization-activated cyclic nucleotide-gated channel 1-like n=1 Tax=Vespa mandarinia TaxID=7446 RepID=UPI0016132CB8|nr:potassium/sodium hyperpolarization-activated cyclic nucleotide-gated channel 1-like [Vespa mandarinia]
MFKRQLSVHICKLKQISDSNLPKLPPNANIFARWKRRYQKLILVSAKHPLTRFCLRSRVAIAFEKRRHGRSSYWWIIHPYSILRYYQKEICNNYITHIYNLSDFFGISIAKNADPELLTIVYPAYVICIIDIILNFITGYVSMDSHKIFLNPCLIIRHYVKTYFFIDLVSSIPYTWFYKQRILPSGPNSNYIFLLLEILPILKIIRLGTLHQYIRQLNIIFGTSHAQRTIIWLIIQTLLIFHWSNCFSYVFPYIVMHIIGDSIENSGTYLVHTELYKQSDWIIYIESLHIGLSNLIGFSFIEFQSFGILDKIAHCILLIFGKCYLIYVIGKLIEPELKYSQIIYEVKNYIREKKLPKHLEDKLVAYFNYKFQGNFFKEQVILNTLSMVLKPVIYMETDIIYKYHEEGDCMYFIASGTVALITFWGKEICHLENGDHFGAEVLINSQKRRTESVLALEVCEVLRFNRQDFKRLVFHGSELFMRIENDITKRHKLIEELEKLHEESEKQKNELKK